MDLKQVAYCKVFPSIGIARVGNSPTEFFVGPEQPGVVPDPPGGFRDAAGRVKRQAARFRLYAFDAHENLLGEVRGATTEIKWTVVLANKKAAWYQFGGANDVAAAYEHGVTLRMRNEYIQPALAAHPDQRKVLCIAPPAAQVAGSDQHGPELVGKFYDPPRDVYLGELRTDKQGRLLVLGGRGESASVLDDNPVKNYANNTGWYDDTSDGPVTAQVKINGTEVEVRGRAWVIVAPPSFAPHTDNIVTAYDVMLQSAIQFNLTWKESECGPKPDVRQVSFQDDIYPILHRLVGYQWVSEHAFRGHGDGKPGDFLQHAVLAQLAAKGGAGVPLRKQIFSKLRNPHLSPSSPEARTQANLFFMPPLSGDEGDTQHGAPSSWLTVTKYQYDNLRRWSDDDFVPNWNGKVEVPWASEAVNENDVSPAVLTRAALLGCEGGAFFPGIELTSIVRFRRFYSESFRASDDLMAGDVTKWMAVPWQADFYECQLHWWPAQRPDDVVNEEQFERLVRDFPAELQAKQLHTVLQRRHRWDRGVGDQGIPEPAPPILQARNAGESAIAYYQRVREGVEKYVGGIFQLPTPAAGETDEAYDRRIQRILAREWSRRRANAGDNDMVEKWKTLGFVVPRTTSAGQTVLVEVDRGAFEGLKHRDCFHLLMNIESHPEFLPHAKDLANTFLAEARRKQVTPGELDHDYYLPFEYSLTAFGARLEQIYEALRADAEAYDPADPDQETVFRTREQVVERIRQMAPFNQTDGSWLRNSGNVGPTDEIRSLLFSIWSDEVGNGDPALNHPNVYVTLMQSLEVFLPPITSREYAEHPDLLDSAFTVPTFELAISQFTEDFFPEILGMTLQLEWEVVYLKRAIKLYRYHGIDAHFLTMHVAIDNAAEGHGACARRAVELYLDHVRSESGTTAMQEHWRRIWDGYIAFATTGSIFSDLRFELRHPKSIQQRMEKLIANRKTFGQKNHGRKKLGENFINEWFEDPSGFLDALARSRFVSPESPENSDFFRLTSFGGPMYKVFGSRELKLWAEWIRSLKKSPTPDSGPLNPGESMIRLVKRMRTAGLAAPGHQHIPLAGPSPSDPAVEITKPISWWFEQVEHADDNQQDQQAAHLLAALRSSRNGWVVVGSPQRSRIVGQLFDYTHPMGHALSGAIHEAGGMTGRDIIWNWIKARCPIRNFPALDAEAPDARIPETAESRIASASPLPARTVPQPDPTKVLAPGPRLRHGMGGYVH
jgi:hypothetical protein